MSIVVRALPDLTSVVITWISVLILYYFLRKKLYTPIKDLLEKRKNNIKEEINSAKELNLEAERTKLEYEERLKEARSEGLDIIESSRKRAEELQIGIVNDAKSEATSIIKKAKNEALREKEVAFSKLREETGEMAIMIASKIIDEELDSNKHKKIIDSFIQKEGA